VASGASIVPRLSDILKPRAHSCKARSYYACNAATHFSLTRALPFQIAASDASRWATLEDCLRGGAIGDPAQSQSLPPPKAAATQADAATGPNVKLQSVPGVPSSFECGTSEDNAVETQHDSPSKVVHVLTALGARQEVREAPLRSRFRQLVICTTRRLEEVPRPARACWRAAAKWSPTG
jgi:hypothetical protein